MLGRTWCRVCTVATLNSRDVIEFDVWNFCVFHNIVLSSDCFSIMSIKFPMYLFPPSSYLPNFFLHILTRILLPVEPKCMFLNTAWDTKLYTHTKQINTFTFWNKYEELRSNWIKNAKNVIWSVYLWTPKYFTPPQIRSWEYWLLRIKFPPNLRLKTILLGWKPPLVNRGVQRIVKNVCWRTLNVFYENWYLNIFRKSVYLKRITCMRDIWREALCTFMVPDWVPLRMKSVTDKCCRLNYTTFSILSIFNKILLCMW